MGVKLTSLPSLAYSYPLRFEPEDVNLSCRMFPHFASLAHRCCM